MDKLIIRIQTGNKTTSRKYVALIELDGKWIGSVFCDDYKPYSQINTIQHLPTNYMIEFINDGLVIARMYAFDYKIE